MNPRALAKLIEECFPKLRVTRYRQILTGWDNIVLEVNDEWIFRFPRFEVSEKNLRKEMVFLPYLSNHLSVAIPQYQYVWDDSKANPRFFAGYRKIQGIPLTVGGFRLAWVNRLSETLSRFLKELHRIRLSAGELRTIPIRNVAAWRETYRRTYRTVRRLVYPTLDGDTRRKAEVFWHDLLKDVSNFDFEPVLVHGDLTSRNIILSPVTGKVIGILDWSDAKVGDPALDFAGLFEVNKHLGEQVLRKYGRNEIEFRSRIDWYVRLIPFYEILWGITQGSEEFKANGMRRIRRRLDTHFVT